MTIQYGGAFIGMQGSWNRSNLVGYKVAFVRFANGKPTGPIEDFLTGFIANQKPAEVHGRPVGVTVLGGGSLLVADDGGKGSGASARSADVQLPLVYCIPRESRKNDSSRGDTAVSFVFLDNSKEFTELAKLYDTETRPESTWSVLSNETAR
jgi:hypothetical protein